ncbi:MAG: hypothetical protein M3478_06465 [Planctomycetota bacterium]|nr:hypothetical protein [Planctomycetota bacterium]
MSRATIPFTMTSPSAPRALGVRRNLWAERLAHALPYLLFAAAMLLLDSMARGATQEEFFKSLQDSVNNGPNGNNGEITGRGFALFLGVVGLIVAALVLAQKLYLRFSRRKPATRGARPLSKPTNINQPRKLMKEIAKAAGLSRDEIRQLKAAADERGNTSPLTLLICPSLLIEAARREGSNADNAVLTRVARRMVSDSSSCSLSHRGRG